MFRQPLVVLLLLGWTSCHALLLQSPLLRGRGGSFFRNGAGRRIVPSAVPLADFPHKLSVPSSLYSAPALLQNKTTDALLPAVLHESDVERLSELLCECLGGGEVRLPNEGFADWERRLLAPPLDAWNSFARSANRYETSLGIRVRCKDRLRFDNVRIRERSGASEEQKKVEDEEEGGEGQGAGETAVSLLDAVGKVDGSLDIAYEPDFDLRDRQSLVLVLEDDERRIVASAELALQPRDGQLPTNFPSLFGFSEDTATGAALAGAGSQGRSDVRRKEKEEEEEEEEEEEGRARYSHYYYPYICNVAVAPRWRRSGLAKRLVRLCEQLAARQWGYAEIYLHVDPSNAAATRLYERAGYVPVPPQERAGPAAILGGLFEVMEPNVTYMWKKL